MTRIALPDDAISKLRTATDSVEICTASGDVVGVYSPKQDYATEHSANFDTSLDISREELRRRAERGTGRPLADLLQEWEKRK